VYTPIDGSTGLPEYSEVLWPNGTERVYPLYDTPETGTPNHEHWGAPAGWESASGAFLRMTYDRPGRVQAYDYRIGSAEPLGNAIYRYDRQDGLLTGKVFNSDGSERYGLTYDYDDLKRVSYSRMVGSGKDFSMREQEWTYDILGKHLHHRVERQRHDDSLEASSDLIAALDRVTYRKVMSGSL